MSPSQRCTDITDTRCPTCSEPVVRFRDEVDLERFIEAIQLPITEDLRRLKEAGKTVWVWNPPSQGWIPKFGFLRDWRELRVEHTCPTRNSKRK